MKQTIAPTTTAQSVSWVSPPSLDTIRMIDEILGAHSSCLGSGADPVAKSSRAGVRMMNSALQRSKRR